MSPSQQRRKCFISYHHDDEAEVRDFIQAFDHMRDTFIARGIGAGMPGDVLNSVKRDYIMRRVRESYLRDSTVTIVMIGRCTWARRYVDWEIASTLRNDARNTRSGLLGIVLPSAAGAPRAPVRLSDNLGNAAAPGYARWYHYPKSAISLSSMIEEAYSMRAEIMPNNSRLLFSNNRECR
ncbi:TIR domain-containing protein [Streptomyces sp. MBT49]|uniref:TIR domain-containing protein n=1 Tax=Streptomyces sp. MBT49 TaxID=1488380 RepID=UPI00190B8B26|nr:TIR domain-containing protein [Streptomyces sp. MBT49]MBK3629662.1 TIR domain-containing protein [Streptomyces sp. MBT49]